MIPKKDLHSFVGEDSSDVVVNSWADAEFRNWSTFVYLTMEMDVPTVTSLFEILGVTREMVLNVSFELV